MTSTPDPPRTVAAVARALALTAVLALAACSSGGREDAAVVSSAPQEDPADEAITTTEAATTTTEDDAATTTDDPDPDAAALAEAVTLTADDFTDSWTSSPPDDDDDESIRDCFTDIDEALVADVTGPDFAQEEPTFLSQIGTTGLVAVDDGSASGLVDELASEDFAACVEGQFGSSLGDVLLDIEVSPAPDVPTTAEQASALNGTLTIEGETGSPIDGEISLWLIRTGPVLTGVSVVVIGDPTPGLDLATLVDETTGAVADLQAAEVG
ncbi:MAG: hypothetical protein ACR2JF_10125 [Iamia sp.]